MSDTRAQLEARLGGLHNLLVRFEDLQAQEDAIEQQHQHRYKAYLKYWRGGMYWLWVLILTVVLSIIAFTIFMSAITSAAVDVSAGGDYGNVGSTMAVGFILLLPLPLALIGAAIVRSIRNSKVPGINAKREQQNDAIYQQIWAEIWPAIEPIRVQLSATSQEYQSNYAGFFPKNYLTAHDVAQCWHIVNDHRADTVQAAVNVYETILHQQRLENAAQESLRLKAQQVKAMQTNNIITASVGGALLGQQAAHHRNMEAMASRPRTVNVRIK